jgi:hypothetical protein
MSSGLECSFIENTPGKWYYFLQQGSCPVQCWDWMEFADGYGPFATEQAAEENLQANHQNPGGWSTQPYSGEDGKPMSAGYEAMEKLIANATIPGRSPARYIGRRF